MVRTVMITGCSSGFGEATARLFALKGWNVVATMRRPEMASTLSQSGEVFITALDVQDRSSIDAAVEAALSRFGRIDALVNNAGFGLWGVFEATSREKVLEQFEVNVFGVMDVTRALLPHFRANRAGVIVNISSGAGVFTLPLISLYCASKFALEGFSESLAYELADLGVAVKLVEPGGVLSTGFGRRSRGEAASVTELDDYSPFVAAARQGLQQLQSTRVGATPEDVAEVIFTAVTDGSNQIRYIGTEQIKPLVTARREKSEEEYIALMRSRFAPKVSA